MRDYVLGARLLTGDGRVLKFGGEVMKNVAGYDVVAPARRIARHPRRAARRLAQGAAGRPWHPDAARRIDAQGALDLLAATARRGLPLTGSFWQRR